MKKQRHRLAAAALTIAIAGSAQAQESSVSIYGIIDTAVEHLGISKN